MPEKKLRLSSSAERGTGCALFIDRDWLMDFEGELCLRSADFEISEQRVRLLKGFWQSRGPVFLTSHQPWVARGCMSLVQLEEINQKLFEKLELLSLRPAEILNCIHCPDSQGVDALCISCSCHPDRGGLFLQAAVRHHLSLSSSFYLRDRKIPGGKAEQLNMSLLSEDDLER